MIGTGSEVPIAVAAREGPAGRRHPDASRLDAVPRVVRRAGRGLPGRVLPPVGPGQGQRRGRRSADLLARLVGDAGRIVRLEHYGASAAYTVLYASSA